MLLRVQNLHQILNILNKKMLKYFRDCLLRKKWLLKYIRGPVSEQNSEVNMLTGPKHLHSTTFIFFLHLSEINWVGKSFSKSDVKS